MTITELLQKELKQEAHTTRKMLARVPSGKSTWQPHPKSMNLRTLTNHIIELPGWIGMALNTDVLDFANNPYSPTTFETAEELLAHFENTVADGTMNLEKANPGRFGELWTLREGDVVYSQSTRLEVIRMAMNQIVHHRAQLGVYLRLLDVPIPGSYGPSADESDFA